LKAKALWDNYQPNNLLAISTNISIANFYRRIIDQPTLLQENKLSKQTALLKSEKILLEQVENCKKLNIEEKTFNIR